MNVIRPVALEERNQNGTRLCSPSASRNLPPIICAFSDNKLGYGRVIEIGAGTGQHAARLVSEFPSIERWVAGEPDQVSRESCLAWAQHENVTDRMSISDLDGASDWARDFQKADLVYSANVIHISPIAVLEGIVIGARKALKPDGRLVFYGPFSREGLHSSDSNEAFDISLKSRNRDWGVRDLNLDVIPRAKAQGFSLSVVQVMPANNLFVVFEQNDV